MNYTILKEKDLYCLTEITRGGFVTLSNTAMSNKLTEWLYWGVTIFLQIGDEEIELEFIYNRPAKYASIKMICPVVLLEYLSKHYPHLDVTDISGKTWKANVMTRVLRAEDAKLMTEEGIPFHKQVYLPGERVDHFEVAYFDKPYEEAKIVNKRPEWLK